MFQARKCNSPDNRWFNFPAAGETVLSLQEWLNKHGYGTLRFYHSPDTYPTLRVGNWEFRYKSQDVLRNAMSLYALGARFITDPDLLHKWFVNRWDYELKQSSDQ